MAGWGTFPQKLSTPLSGILPLINAINERSSASGFTPLIPFTKLKELTGLNILQARITDLIPKFVNHLDNGGDWTGKKTVPNWTEAGILTEIGESRLPYPRSVYELSTKWLEQQKKIINLLLWATSKNFELINKTGGMGIASKATSQSAINAAILKYTPPGSFIGAESFYQDHGNGFTGIVNNGQGNLKFSSMPESINKDYVFYQLVTVTRELPKQDVPADVPYAIFDDNGRGYTPYKLNVIASGSLGAQTEYISTLLGAPAGEFPVYPPSEHYVAWRGWYLYIDLTYTFFVMKFNIPGGFEFVEEN